VAPAAVIAPAVAAPSILAQVPPIPAPAATAAVTAPAAALVIRSGVPDDLKRIKGIGVVLEKKLHGLGVINYGQIAGWSQGEIDKMSDVLDFKGRIERENWIEQARILATGGITDFARRVDRGEVETSKPRPVR
jgi:predicted flap endonuclease-1-like 5' DNA nuclease